jgi:4-oxalomesaconate hydratase
VSRTLLSVDAHAADFLWRSGGVLALAAEGGESHVLALSYGEKGESGELWKEEGQTIDNARSASSTHRSRSVR